jgi:hypothetical protein
MCCRDLVEGCGRASMLKKKRRCCIMPQRRIIVSEPEMCQESRADRVAATPRRTACSNQGHINQTLQNTDCYPDKIENRMVHLPAQFLGVIEAAKIKELPEKLKWRLSTILLGGRHVQVIKESQYLRERRIYDCKDGPHPKRQNLFAFRGSH